MILQALAQLAEIEHLVPDPDFEIKPVAWTIVLRPDGNLVAIESRRTDLNAGAKRKPKYVGNPMLVPRQPIRTSGDLAFFLVDKSEYALGFDPTATRPAKKLQDRVALFRGRVEECLAVTQDSGIAAMAAFFETLESQRFRIEQLFKELSWAPNDQFAFRVGLSSEPVHLSRSVKGYWKEIRNQTPAGDSTPTFQCIISGELISEAGLFPLIKKVPGGTSSGVSFISFNARAFESYGLSSNENAPVSRESAEKVATALNRLIDTSYPDPRNAEQALPPRSIRISSDTMACFWSASNDRESQNALDALSGILEAEKEENVAQAYRSVWRGKPARIRDPSAFYVLILSGAQGRAVVRDWIQSTLGDTLGHLSRHFDDLKMVRSARPKKGAQETPAIPLRWLMSVLAAEGKSEGIPASLEAAFLRAAFTGTPYPFQLLQRTLVRSRVEAGRDEWLDRARFDARTSIMRAVLNRRRRNDPQLSSQYPEVPVAFDPNTDSQGYSLGALMAVLERLQQIALGDVNASVIDRYFSAASASPRSVFVRLLKNSRHHASKVTDSSERKERGLGQRLDRMIDFVCSRFEISRNRYPYRAMGIPAHLDLEQQGLFVIGYHQMRYWLWMPKDERAQWEADHPNAPPVFRYGRSE